MAYADFKFYTDSYGGSAISEKDFPMLSNLASAYIDAATMGRAKRARGDAMDSVKMATCALSEVFLNEENINAANFSEDSLLLGLSSQTVGGWSQGYNSRSASTAESEIIEKQKRDILIRYLSLTGLLRVKGYYARRCGEC